MYATKHKNTYQLERLEQKIKHLHGYHHYAPTFNEMSSKLREVELSAIRDYKIDELYKFIKKRHKNRDTGWIAWQKFTRLCIAEINKLDHPQKVYYFIKKYPLITVGCNINKAAYARVEELDV